jgi:hypothetical protein
VPQTIENGVGVASLREQDIAVIDEEHVHVYEVAVGHRWVFLARLTAVGVRRNHVS